MVARDELLAYLSSYLKVDDFQDYGPQGLQVEGRERVERIVTGVSANRDLIEAAVSAGAEMILVHHGVFWDGDSPVLRGWKRDRIALLLQHEITLAGYHLCLDAHPDVGNNALAARELGLEHLRPWVKHQSQYIGWRGAWPEPRTLEEATDCVNRLYGSESLVLPGTRATISNVGIVSGGAQREIFRAIEDGLDLFVTGEASEFVMSAAREGGTHFIAAGHHNTERIGIRALGEHLSREFQVAHEFIDIPNPV